MPTRSTVDWEVVEDCAPAGPKRIGLGEFFLSQVGRDVAVWVEDAHYRHKARGQGFLVAHFPQETRGREDGRASVVLVLRQKVLFRGH